MNRRLIVGITGASGAPLATELLRRLREQQDLEIHLIYTRGAELTLQMECGCRPETWESMADRVYNNEDLGAAPASGSFTTMGMIIAPCSMKTLAGIHSGYSDSLLLRAADVVLKERRKLVMAPRETPLSPIHLRNMHELSMMGAVILPPMLSYYQSPGSVEDCTGHIVGKLLDQFGLESKGFRRWNGPQARCHWELRDHALNREITARLTRLDGGLAVLITGGGRSHVGAVVCEGPEGSGEFTLPGHREDAVCRQWAGRLSKATGEQVWVACGIHYDGLSPDGLKQVLAACGRLLDRAEGILKM